MVLPPPEPSFPWQRVSGLMKQRLRQLQQPFHPLRTRLEQEPFYRFQSLQEVALAGEWGFRLDVNRATVDDWLRLPGLSIHQARSLVSLNHAGLQFTCLEDLAAALGVPVSTVQPLNPVLAFCYYDDASLVSPQPLNANAASVEDLCRLPGVETALAVAIVRERQGQRFRSAADLQQRLQLPISLMEQLIYYLRF